MTWADELAEFHVGRYLLYLAALGVFLFVGRDETASLGLAFPSPWQEAVTGFFATLSLVFLANFARSFLELSTTAPRWDRIVRGMRILLAVMVVSSLGLPWMPSRALLDLTVLAGLVTQLLLLVGAVLAWRAGTRQARYFVAAFLAFVLGLLPSIRIWLWPAALDDTAQAGFTMLAGSALELLLFSMATAERFTRLQQEKLAAQVALREEAERRRTIEEAYADELELEVRERTRELEEANHDKSRMMVVLGHDLRSPLAGLTQAAELLAEAGPTAAPGRFFADAGRTGRQMLRLIEDLLLWSRIRPGELRPRPQPRASLYACLVRRCDQRKRGPSDRPARFHVDDDDSLLGRKTGRPLRSHGRLRRSALGSRHQQLSRAAV